MAAIQVGSGKSHIRGGTGGEGLGSGDMKEGRIRSPWNQEDLQMSPRFLTDKRQGGQGGPSVKQNAGEEQSRPGRNAETCV